MTLFWGKKSHEPGQVNTGEPRNPHTSRNNMCYPDALKEPDDRKKSQSSDEKPDNRQDEKRHSLTIQNMGEEEGDQICSLLPQSV